MKPVTSLEVVRFISEIERENIILKERISSIESRSINIERFYNSTMTPDEVARLHGLSGPTIRKWVELGIIEKHPQSKDGKTLIRVTDALMLNVKDAKYNARFEKHLIR